MLLHSVCLDKPDHHFLYSLDFFCLFLVQSIPLFDLVTYTTADELLFERLRDQLGCPLLAETILINEARLVDTEQGQRQQEEVAPKKLFVGLVA